MDGGEGNSKRLKEIESMGNTEGGRENGEKNVKER